METQPGANCVFTSHKGNEMSIQFLKYWRGDEIAECVSTKPYLTEEENRNLYVKLWDIAREQVKLRKRVIKYGDDVVGNEARFYLTDEFLSHFSSLTEKELSAIKKGMIADKHIEDTTKGQ